MLELVAYSILLTQSPPRWGAEGPGDQREMSGTSCLAVDQPVRVARLRVRTSLGQSDRDSPLKGHLLDRIPAGITPTMTVFSPTGDFVAYVGKKGKEERVFWKGKPGKTFDRIQGLLFNEMGTVLAYNAQLGEQEYMVAANEVGKAYDEVNYPHFRHDSNELVFRARKGTEWILRVGKESLGGKYSFVGDFAFSSDGTSLAYVAAREKKDFVVVNGTPQKGFDHILSDTLVYSRKGKHLAYGAKSGDHEFVVIDGEPCKPYYHVGRPTISPNGAHVAYVARLEQGPRLVLVLDNEESEPFDFLESPVFSPDSKKLAYVATKGKDAFLVIWKGERLRFDYVAAPAFNKDGILSFVAGTEENGRSKQFVVSNGKKGLQYEHIGKPLVLGDAGWIAYAAKKRGKWVVVANGKESRMFDDVWLYPQGGSDGRVKFGARLGRELWWHAMRVDTK